MNRKLTGIIAVIVSIMSIVVVTLFGVKASERETNIPVSEIMFVDRENGTKDNKIKKNLIEIELSIDELAETMELYYYVLPENATNKKVKASFEGVDYETDIKRNDAELSFVEEREGVIILDFKGITYKRFTVTITSEDSRLKNDFKNYEFNFI